MNSETKSEGSGNRYERVIDGRKVSIDPKVEVSHLNRGTTKRVPLTQCESFIDCRRVESRWVTTSGCDRY